MAERALLVTDLDGTLLGSDHMLGERNRAALARAGAAGVTRVVATGRSLFSLRRVLPADAPVDYVLFSSGAAAVTWGAQASARLLFRHALAAPSVARALAFAAARAMDVMVHAPPPDSHRFGYRACAGGHPDLHARIRSYREHAFALPAGAIEGAWRGPACQLVAIPEAGDAAAQVEDARRALPELQVIRTTSPLDRRSLWLEIFPKDVCKSRAAAWLAQRLDVAPERSFAIGNDWNDADLLAWAHAPAVVDNACAELKALHPVYADHDAGGVADFIDQVVLAS